MVIYRAEKSLRFFGSHDPVNWELLNIECAPFTYAFCMAV